MHSLNHRRLQPEWMDQPDLDRQLHGEALRGLARVNRVSGTVGVLWDEIDSLVQQHPSRTWHVLEVACGGGETAVGLWQRARHLGLSIRMSACDRSSVAIEHAKRQAKSCGAEVDFFSADVLRDPLPEDVDIVCSSLFLHHLTEGELVTFFSRCRESGVQMLLASDLLRSWRGYWLAWCGVRLLTRSRICHIDGPVSVQAAYTVEEMRKLSGRAGLREVKLTRQWPQRYLLNWRRS